ncbi:HTH-type transcriptional activator RhaS [bioreactor metagenome]|uniref:HTH-type transcriptional activator RhaS n=1 Tax=bioreactor metagenome TaxID=1076179 RepID=A0A645FL15_9ZZZZ
MEHRRRISELCFEALQFVAAPDQRPGYPDSLRTILSLIEQNFAQPLSVGDLAAAAGVTKIKVNRLFKLHLDTTPHRYLTAYRMRQAEALLRGGLRVKEAAARVGYENPLNFSTEFKKFFSSPPKEFVRQR